MAAQRELVEAKAHEQLGRKEKKLAREHGAVRDRADLQLAQQRAAGQQVRLAFGLQRFGSTVSAFEKI